MHGKLSYLLLGIGFFRWIVVHLLMLVLFCLAVVAGARELRMTPDQSGFMLAAVIAAYFAAVLADAFQDIYSVKGFFTKETPKQ